MAEVCVTLVTIITFAYVAGAGFAVGVGAGCGLAGAIIVVARSVL